MSDLADEVAHVARVLHQQVRYAEKRVDECLAFFAAPQVAYPLPQRARTMVDDVPIEGVTLDQVSQAIAIKELNDLKSRLKRITMAIQAGKLADSIENMFLVERFLHGTVASWVSTGSERFWTYQEARREQMQEHARKGNSLRRKCGPSDYQRWNERYRTLKENDPAIDRLNAAKLIAKDETLSKGVSFETIRKKLV